MNDKDLNRLSICTIYTYGDAKCVNDRLKIILGREPTFEQVLNVLSSASKLYMSYDCILDACERFMYCKTNKIMKTKELPITPPEGYEIDKEKSTPFEHIVFKEIERKLPQSWEEIGKVKGWWISGNCVIKGVGCGTSDANRNIVPSKPLAEAIIALEQLLMLRHVYNNGIEPAYSGGGNTAAVWCIIPYNDKLRVDSYYYTHRVMSFIDRATAEAFFTAPKIRELLEIAKPLL